MCHSLGTHLEERPCWRSKWKNKNSCSSHCKPPTSNSIEEGKNLARHLLGGCLSLQFDVGRVYKPEDTGANCILKMFTIMMTGTRDCWLGVLPDCLSQHLHVFPNPPPPQTATFLREIKFVCDSDTIGLRDTTVWKRSNYNSKGNANQLLWTSWQDNICLSQYGISFAN